MRAIFDWLEFKEVGDELSRNTEEAFIRSAIARYYYAIFSAIREYLIYIKHQYQFLSNKYVHRRVWKFLIRSKNSNEREIGELLGKWRPVRNAADYDKKHDYSYFSEELANIHNEIENAVNSVIYLRNNYCGEYYG